jgi:anti-sigma-K factor RskA
MDRNANSLCDEYRPLLAAHALGEREMDAEARAHLQTCEECRGAYGEYAAVARALPFAAPEVAPPAHLRQRIIDAVETPPAVTQPTRRSVPAPPLRRALPRALGLWAALALIAIGGLLGWNLTLRSQLDTQARQIVASREGWQTMVALMNDPEVRATSLAGSAARGSLWSVPGRDVACLMALDLPALASDQVYQVWLLDGERRVSGGVFEGRSGSGWVIVRAEAPLGSYEGIAVTVEPRGGSASPSGPEVLAGLLARPQAQ